GLTTRRLPNEPIFPPNPNKLKPLAPFRVEATSPGTPLPAETWNQGGGYAPLRLQESPRTPARFGPFCARPDAGWKAVGSHEWLRYRAISATQVMRER